MRFPRRATALALTFAALALGAPGATAANADASARERFGVYADLVDSAMTGPKGWPRKAWRWNEDGESILELWQESADVDPEIVVIRPAQRAGRLVRVFADGHEGKGEVKGDGAVVWATDGEDPKAEHFKGTPVRLKKGALEDEHAKLTKAKDLRWVEPGFTLAEGKPRVKKGKGGAKDAALESLGEKLGVDLGKGKGKGKAGGEVVRSQRNAANGGIVAQTNGAQGNGNAPGGIGLDSASSSNPRPNGGNASPQPAENYGESLDCAMQSAAVRARGCKPPATATNANANDNATGGAGGGATTVLSVDGQAVRVTQGFPANILGRYLYERKGEPIIQLNGDGTGLFQAHMIAPIPIEWWLKANANGTPEKITGANGSYRYVVVLQYGRSSNGNYPTGSYAMWYLDTDVTTGCSIILGERFKCR